MHRFDLQGNVALGPYLTFELLEKYAQGLRLAGLPE
jgi:hypothetical protein